jgi:vitamin B12 transporter
MKIGGTRNSLDALRSLVAVGAALAASSGAAQQAAPEEIVVTSSIIAQPRRQIGTAMSVIDFDDVELRGYTDLADVLRTQAGIGVSNSGGPGKPTAVRIRGEEHFRTLLVIDGVKALDPSAPQVAPSFDGLLTTSDLERIEVLRGPQGFIYGADAGGVVNVITKRGADAVGGQLGLEYGDYSTRKLDGALSGGSNGGDYYFSVVDYETDGFNARTADAVLQDLDGAENMTMHAKLGWNLAESLRVQLVARDIEAQTAYDGCFSPATFATVHGCSSTTDQQIYKLSAEHSTGGVSNTFGFSTIDVVRDDFTEGARSFGSDGEVKRVEYTGSYKASQATTFVYGLDFHDETLIDDDGPSSRDQKGYYLEYQGALADTFFVSLGARYDDNDAFGSHTSSRLSLAYVRDLGSESSIKYRASVGTGFRAPSLYELAYNTGPFAFPPAAGVALTEESSHGYDVGIEYDAANIHFEITYFDQEIEDEIFFDLVGFSGYLQSTGTSSSKGVEVAADIPLGAYWALVANWTKNDALDAIDQPRLRRPETLGNLGLQYRAPEQRLGFIVNYRVARDSIDVDGATLDDYEVVDLSLTYALADGFELFGRVQNATDEAYQEVVGYNTAERSLYGGVRLRF